MCSKVHFVAFFSFLTTITRISQTMIMPQPAEAKGQLISEWNFGVFKSPKKANQMFDRFLP